MRVPSHAAAPSGEDLFEAINAAVGREDYTEAARLLKNGVILVDDVPAKPASEARPGTTLRIETETQRSTWEILEIPTGNVAKRNYERYARRTSLELRERPSTEG